MSLVIAVLSGLGCARSAGANLVASGSRVYEHVFLGSCAVAGYVVLSFVLPALPAGWVPPSPVASEFAVPLVAVGMLYYAGRVALKARRRRAPELLATPAGYSEGEGLISIALWSVLSYAALAVACSMLALAFVPREDHHWPLVVMGLGLWLPLFLAVPTGTALAWWRLKRQGWPGPVEGGPITMQ